MKIIHTAFAFFVFTKYLKAQLSRYEVEEKKDNPSHE
jgi:hypothetical protein